MGKGKEEVLIFLVIFLIITLLFGPIIKKGGMQIKSGVEVISKALTP